MGKVMGKAVRVAKKDAQRVKNELRELGLIDNKRAVESGEEYVYIPVLEGLCDYEVVEVELEGREARKGFAQLLEERFGEDAVKGVISSYEVIGDIAIVQIPGEMEALGAGGEKGGSVGKEIGELLLEGDNKVKAVWKKAGGREGKFRVTKIEHLAGEARSETEYVENGVRMRLDISRVYFSPRLSNERKRIMESARDGENVLVLFAGVGPFALEVAKAHPKCRVAGVELNPDAVRYFKENIALNKLKNVEAVLGDAKEACKVRFALWADRIAMPLPMHAEEFLEPALLAAKDGCIVHFYRMVERDGGVESAKKRIKEVAHRIGKNVEFVFEREVRPYSASSMQVVIDFRVLAKS
jgi:tRNA (guanine37-N1)-methyltransferase